VQPRALLLIQLLLLSSPPTLILSTDGVWTWRPFERAPPRAQLTVPPTAYISAAQASPATRTTICSLPTLQPLSSLPPPRSRGSTLLDVVGTVHLPCFRHGRSSASTRATRWTQRVVPPLLCPSHPGTWCCATCPSPGSSAARAAGDAAVTILWTPPWPYGQSSRATLSQLPGRPGSAPWPRRGSRPRPGQRHDQPSSVAAPSGRLPEPPVRELNLEEDKCIVF